MSFRVAFSGLMRSGKDTSAAYLMNTHGGGVNLKFADPLYEMETAIYQIAGLEIPEEKERRRYLLQILGTDWGRNTVSQNIWVDIMERRVKSYLDSTNVFCTDMRFPNEIDVLKNLGFTLVNIQRPDEARIAAGASHQTHASETALNGFTGYDFVIQNDGSLEDLYKKLDAVVALYV